MAHDKGAVDHDAIGGLLLCEQRVLGPHVTQWAVEQNVGRHANAS
jgi:hypothetical protein